MHLQKADFTRADYFWRPKRTVLLLPGYLLSKESDLASFEQNASGNIKCVEQALTANKHAKDTDLYCVAYSRSPTDPELNRYLSNTSKSTSNTTPSDEESFVDNILMPLMGFRVEAHPSVDSICQHLSKVTLVCHSYGATFAKNACDILREKMSKNGYSNPDIERVSREIVAITLGSPVPLQQEKPSYRTISFSAQCDRRLWYAFGKYAQEAAPEKPAPLQTQLYEALGLDAALLQSKLKTLETETYYPTSNAFKSAASSHGLAFFADLPNHLEWDEKGGKRKVEAYVPEHTIQMFFYHGNTQGNRLSNHHMVDRVTKALGNAVERPVSDPAQWRQEVKAMTNDTPKTMQASRGKAS